MSGTSRPQTDSGPPSALSAQPARNALPQDKGRDGLSSTNGPTGSDTGLPPTPGSTAPPREREDVDPLLDTDDQTLEELLADLGEDQPWLDEVAAEEKEHRRVTALLEELGKAPSNEVEERKAVSRDKKPDGDPGGSNTDDDDSEGDEMTHEADDVLARALDEVELENSRQEASAEIGEAKVPTEKPSDTQDTETPPPPPRPSGPAHARDPPPSGDSFALPTVPSQLQDQADDDLSETDAGFEASIASRMAALRVSAGPALPSAPATDVNALGLPGAPTFAPHNRPVPRPLLGTRRGFTDDDQKAWCTVCLEDATVRCRGCDGDVYCARCWKEMHVGPRAGYEERGHRWEKFVRT